MFWLIFIPLQIFFFAVGVRQYKRAGQWSWSGFAFALGFAAVECFILIGPIIFIGAAGKPHFAPIWTAAWIIAALNFIWFLRIMRHWKMSAAKSNPTP
jgi:hypothetical protein